MTSETNRIVEDELQLIDISEEDDYLIAFPFYDSLEDLRLSGANCLLSIHLPLDLVTYDNLNECDRIKLFECINSQAVEQTDQAKSESMEPRRPSFLRKSLAWDSAFFTSAGVLNLEELFMINKGFNKPESNRSSPVTQKQRIPPHTITHQNQTSSASKKTNIYSQNKAKPGVSKLVSSKQTNKPSSIEGSSNMKTKNKTRKAGLGPDLTVSKRSRWGDLSGLPKSTTSFSSPITQKDSKLHSSSSASSSSKSIRRKINSRNTKPTASTSTSPCSSIERWFSESLSLSSNNTHHNSPDFDKEHATRSSIGASLLLSGGPTKSSGLRMPSPKIGFFDEIQEQPFRASMEVSFGKQSPLPTTNKLNKNKFHLSNISPSITPESYSKVRKTLNGENDGRKFGASFSKLKPTRQIPKERKKQKDQKENVCSFEDQVNGLTRCFEVIDLDKDMGQEVKGQVSVHSSRTPLAEKTSG